MRKNNFLQEEDNHLEMTRARFLKLECIFLLGVSNVLKRHGELAERLSRDSDKMIFERLQREFEAAIASQTQEISLDGEQWNDGLLATIRERVHMEAERKAMQLPGDTSMLHGLPFHDKITYKVANKIICCLEGARIGIQYETTFAGEPCELFHCVLESKSFLEKMTVLEHTVPFFLPIREAENEFLSSNAMKFIDHVGDLLQAYVDRREQLPFLVVFRFALSRNYTEIKSKNFTIVFRTTWLNFCLTIMIDLVSILPTGVSVLAWPMHRNFMNKKGGGPLGSKTIPERLSYAEDALRTMSLPEAYAEIVLNLPHTLQEIYPHNASS
ncbi:uncharacterized protein LOC113763107 isoform X2 [Coffea eugenioides]|uniref:Uncharacterized protein isoform X2 n=1 Tax=Coffea arabica TaxID=13443 RepID=A0ABM4X022_COFAR|nr:uncharacterized protein LOC113763107 isoform X2 [Coffea eugenioides]